MALYTNEVRQRAIRILLAHPNEYPLQWPAIESLVGEIGCETDTLQQWLRQAEPDANVLLGQTTFSRVAS